MSGGVRQYTCAQLMQQRLSPHMVLRSFEAQYGLPIALAQEKFFDLLQKTIQFSPPRGWLKAITKEVVELIENSGESCIDELVDLAIRSSCHKPADDTGEAEHAIYHVNNRDIVIRRMRLHNEVGTKVWTAGMFLSELCVQNAQLFSNANVLELGAGVGITGLSLATNASPPKTVIISDFGLDTMSNMRYNVTVNNKIQLCESPGVSLLANELDWAKCYDYHKVKEALDVDPEEIDIILAADCVYSPDLCLALTSAIENLLRFSSAKCSKMSPPAPRICSNDCNIHPGFVKGYPFALIVSTLRNPDTFSIFLRALEESSLVCADVSQWASENTDFGASFIPIYESHTDVVLVHCLQYIPSEIRKEEFK